jgi:hypothetical protein
MHKLPKILALLIISPFLLAFTTPEEAGTTVSVSAGGGRYLTASGCARPRLVEIADQQVGAYHQRAVDKEGRLRYGLGLDVDILEGRDKECTEEDCHNPGWQGYPILASTSPYATLDWYWFGLRLGGQIPLRTRRDGEGELIGPSDWLLVPVRGSLRLGYPQRLYLSLEVLDGRPVFSGAMFPIGIGGRVLGTDLWAAPSPDLEKPGLSARVARRVGPVRLRLSGRVNRLNTEHSAEDWQSGEVIERFGVDYTAFAVSAGIDYHFPW